MVEVIRIMTRALQHETYGVNAQLDTLPRDPADPPTPPVTLVLDPTVRDHVLSQVPSLDYPVLVVGLLSPVESTREFSTVMRDYENTSISIDIISASLDAALTTQDALYMIRAIIACIRDLMDEANEPDQNMDDICYLAVNSVAWGPVQQQIDHGVIVGTVLVNLVVRDRRP